MFAQTTISHATGKLFKFSSSFRALRKRFTGFFFQSSIGRAPVVFFFFFLRSWLTRHAGLQTARRMHARHRHAGEEHGSACAAVNVRSPANQRSTYRRRWKRFARILSASPRPLLAVPRRRTPLTFGHPCTCAVVLAVSQTVINQAMSMRVSRFDCQCFSTDFPSFHCSLSISLSL
jgi:hypothetical protein